MLFGLIFTTLLIAPQAFGDDLSSEQWRVYNRVFTPSLWDINKAARASQGVSFPINVFVAVDAGSFAVYLMNNYNKDLTKKETISAMFNWSQTSYHTRSGSGGYVRIWFQDVASGPYDSNDYWWCHSASVTTFDVSLNDTVAAAGTTLSCNLNDRSQWMNQAGRYADDTTENWTDWTGAIVTMSPYNGFDRAKKNVKQLGLAFGGPPGSYASGFAADVVPATFNMTSYTIN
jgi:hypothetical protein